MLKIRLWLTAAFSYLAWLCAPQLTRPLLAALHASVSGIPNQMRLGRTYGVITAPWGRGADINKAIAMQSVTFAPLAAKRAEIEAEDADAARPPS